MPCITCFAWKQHLHIFVSSFSEFTHHSSYAVLKTIFSDFTAVLRIADLMSVVLQACYWSSSFDCHQAFDRKAFLNESNIQINQAFLIDPFYFIFIFYFFFLGEGGGITKLFPFRVLYLSHKSYEEVLFLQHRVALSELCGLGPWMLHITDVLQVEMFLYKGGIWWKMCYISRDQPCY